jgi:hypothetical protein
VKRRIGRFRFRQQRREVGRELAEVDRRESIL